MMTALWSRIGILIVCLLLVAGCSKPGDLAGSVARQGSVRAPGAGQMAPDFVVPLLDGGSLQLSELRGQPVVLYFWATWCGSCTFDLPIIESVYQQEGHGDTIFITVNVGQSADEVQDFMVEHGYRLPVGLDGALNIGRAYRLLGFPSTYFIDRTGKIQNLRIGPISEETFLQRIAQIQ